VRGLVIVVMLLALCGCTASPPAGTAAREEPPARDEIGDGMRSIVAIGDSITEAVGFNGVTSTDQWLYLLLERLGETDIEFGAGIPSAARPDADDVLVGAGWTAYNLGVSGQTTAEMLARFDREVPDDAGAIIIAGGLNDVFAGIPRAEIIDNIEAMVQEAQAITDRVFVCALPPCTGDSEAIEDEIVALNEAYQEVCDVTGATYVDWYAALVANDGSRDSGYSDPDGVHPNAEGNARLAEAFDIVADFGW
jgi:acyl-CoA thioesterase-1